MGSGLIRRLGSRVQSIVLTVLLDGDSLQLMLYFDSVFEILCIKEVNKYESSEIS